MDTLTCHGESQDVQGRNPGKLAVIAPRLERIKLEEIISEWTEKSGADIYFGIRCNDTLEPAHITKGRGTDDAPQGARMIHVGLLTVKRCSGIMPRFFRSNNIADATKAAFCRRNNAQQTEGV